MKPLPVAATAPSTRTGPSRVLPTAIEPGRAVSADEPHIGRERIEWCNIWISDGKGIAVQAQQVARRVLESLKQAAADETCGLRAGQRKWKPLPSRGATFKPDEDVP